MSLRVSEHNFNGPTTPYTSYNSSKTNLGTLIVQRTGSTETDNWAGPFRIEVARPMEASVAIALAYPHVVEWSPNMNWVFLVENGTAAATRRIVLYEHVLSNNTLNWKGYTTLGLNRASTHTIRGFRALYETYTTGSVQVNGTQVTGSGTFWRTDGMCSGSRIGFGSTLPYEISQSNWYYINYISSDSSSILSTNAGTWPSSTPYVIEDLRFALASVATPVASGGLYLATGINYDDFQTVVVPINSSSVAYNKGVKHLIMNYTGAANANTGSAGVAIEPKDSWQNQDVYVLDGAATLGTIYKYNIRAELTSFNPIIPGQTTSSFLYATGQQVGLTGNISQLNNCRFGTLSHGPTSGSAGIYFVTTTRCYFVPHDSVISGSTSFIGSAMVEVPPGGSSTYGLTNALSSVEIAGSIDRLVIMSTGTAGARSYVTKFNSTSDTFDHIFLNDDKQTDQSISDSGGTPHPSIQATAMSVWVEGGIMYLCRNGTTSILNQLYVLPAGAHWTYAQLPGNNNQLITPEIFTPNCVRFKKVYVNNSGQVGDGTFGLQPEPFRMYYRTSGITDNSGTWILLSEVADITSVNSSTSIQFAFEFKTIGQNCIPNRIYSVAVVYEDQSTDSHYQPSVGNSDPTNKIFAWRFSTAFGGTVPSLKIELFDAISGGTLLTDYTNSGSFGTWQKSTAASPSWGLYDTTDKANDTTYIRYTPNTLGDNIRVRALLTQA